MILLPRGGPPLFLRMASTGSHGVKPDIHYPEHRPPMSTSTGIRAPNGLPCQPGPPAGQTGRIGPDMRLIDGRQQTRINKAWIDSCLSESRIAGHDTGPSRTRPGLERPASSTKSQNAQTTTPGCTNHIRQGPEGGREILPRLILTPGQDWQSFVHRMLKRATTAGHSHECNID